MSSVSRNRHTLSYRTHVVPSIKSICYGHVVLNRCNERLGIFSLILVSQLSGMPGSCSRCGIPVGISPTSAGVLVVGDHQRVHRPKIGRSRKYTFNVRHRQGLTLQAASIRPDSYRRRRAMFRRLRPRWLRPRWLRPRWLRPRPRRVYVHIL